MCWWSYCTLFSFCFCPTNPDMLTAAHFSSRFISAQTLGFWEAFASQLYVDPETTQTPPVCSEFLHIDERLEFDGMCLWAMYESRAMSSPSYRKYRWCSHFNCWEATIWFTRRIVWISLALSLRHLKACWWSYPRIWLRMWCGRKNSQPTQEAALK